MYIRPPDATRPFFLGLHFLRGQLCHTASRTLTAPSGPTRTTNDSAVVATRDARDEDHAQSFIPDRITLLHSLAQPPWSLLLPLGDSWLRTWLPARAQRARSSGIRGGGLLCRGRPPPSRHA